MKKRTIAGASVLVALVAGLAVWQAWRSPSMPAGWIDPDDTASVVQGRQVYVMYCAACHGANLEGQPDWRDRLPNGRLPAPPHDPIGHTWHHPDGMLFDMVKNGLVPGRTAPPGYESDMPAYRDILSDHDIRAVIAFIKSTWPEPVRKAQEEVTREQAHAH